jgi:transcriptional regulator with XRE-family HTH domain
MFLLDSKGITRHKMLTDLDINHNAFAKWKSPDCIPDAKNLIKLSPYFEVSTDYLLGINELPADSQELNNAKKQFIDSVTDLDDSEIQRAREFVDYIRSQRDK